MANTLEDGNLQLNEDFTRLQSSQGSVQDLAALQLSGTAGVLGIAQGGTGGATVVAARSGLGLGTMAVENSNSVSVSGGTITGITDLAVADGGTGASTAANARANLGIPKYNSAAVAPAVTDDTAAGYSVNSLWTDTALDDGYLCVDATNGAAVWKKIT